MLNNGKINTGGMPRAVYDPTNRNTDIFNYVDTAVTGLLDYRGSYDASTNLFPSTGGSGVGGNVLKGDFWIISVQGTLGGQTAFVGDMIISKVDTPGQTAGNWDIISVSIPLLPINRGGTNASSFTTPSGTICPLVFFDGTKLTTDTSVTHLGYDTATDTVYLTSQVVSSGATNQLKMINTSTSGASAGAGISAYSDDGAALASGDRLAYYTWGGSVDALHTLVNSCAITGYATENWSATAYGSRLDFETTQNGTTTRSTKMTILGDGNIGIATTSPTVKFHIASGQLRATTTASTTVYGFDHTTTSLASNLILRLGAVTAVANGISIVQDASSNVWISIDPASVGKTTINSGNFGVGTTTPLYKVDILGTTNTNIFRCSDGTRALSSYIGTLNGIDGVHIGALTTHPLGFYTAGSIKMLIDISGNVTIGTTATALGTLHIAGSTTVNPLYISGLGPLTGSYRNTAYFTASNSAAAMGISLENSGVAAVGTEMGINYYANRTTGGQTQYSRIITAVKDIGNTTYSSDYSIQTTASGTLATRIYVDSAGKVGVNTTTPGFTFDVNGNISSVQTYTGTIYSASGGTNQISITGRYSNSTAGTMVELAKSQVAGQNFTNSSGTAIAVSIIPTYNQTGTAGATDLFVNRTETAVGSGAQLLADFQVNGVSKFKVDNTGNVFLGNLTSIIIGNSGYYNGSSLNGTLIAPNISATGFAYTKTDTNTSGTSYGFKILPTYNQTSGTAANTDLLINRTQTAVGSGAQLLCDLQVNGVSKFKVDNTGSIAIGNTVAVAAAVASTHKVTVVIGGVTYYLLASNV